MAKLYILIHAYMHIQIYICYIILYVYLFAYTYYVSEYINTYIDDTSCIYIYPLNQQCSPYPGTLHPRCTR